MKHIIVTNQVYGYDGASSNTVLTTDNINALDTGGLAIFNHATGAIVASGTSLGATPNQTYMFAVANGADGTVKPDIISIQWNKVKKITKKAVVAAAAKVMAFGDTTKPLAFGDIVANSTYTLVIEDLEKSIHDITRKKYYTVVSVSGDTATTLVNKLVAKVTADSNQTVTAAAYDTNKGIKFTGAVGKDFRIQALDDLASVGWVIESAKSDNSAAFINGIYYDGSTTPTLTVKYGATPLLAGVDYKPYTPGFGTYAQIKSIVEELSSHKGDTKSTYRTTAFYNANTNLESGATYVLYDIEYSGGASSSPMQAESFTLHLMIAAKTGVAIIDTLDSMLVTESGSAATLITSMGGEIDELQSDVEALQNPE